MSLDRGIEELPELRPNCRSDCAIRAACPATVASSSSSCRCCTSISARRSSRESYSSPDTRQNSATTTGRTVTHTNPPR
jgi:hypothetical protein